jgi:hypothetical protein
VVALRTLYDRRNALEGDRRLEDRHLLPKTFVIHREAVMNKQCIRVLGDLENLKRSFGASPRPLLQNLRALRRCKFDDAGQLIRFHETLLFFSAYPPSATVLEQVEEILKTFAGRVSPLRETEADLAPLDEVEVSGIAGTSVTSNFSYAIVRWLVAKHAGQLLIDWDWFEDEERFGATVPRFLPLLEEDAMVEAHVPYRAWLQAARGRTNELVWLIERFNSLRISDKEKAELYDSLKIHVTWKFGSRPSRTHMKRSVRKSFFHNTPLISRREISLTNELSSSPTHVQRISRSEGEKILDMARETSAVRYRELHGFTYGDPSRVLRADLGRGTEVFVMGVPPEHRLPLRAYHAALVFKNGVPVAYFEGLSIFERMESGFNLYYTFREGETAWLYSRILHLMRQLLGVTVFSIDPYQVGHENEEGIESGAFWFYRKLGFRPVQPELLSLTRSEERQLASDSRRRTSARTLRKLAAGHMLFEMPVTHPRGKAGEWDRFEVRNVGLAVQRRMAREFESNPERMQAQSLEMVKRTLKLRTGRWSEAELNSLKNLALVLAMIPGIDDWSSSDKNLAADIIRAKGSRDEAHYLRFMQKHSALRSAFIKFGSARAG